MISVGFLPELYSQVKMAYRRNGGRFVPPIVAATFSTGRRILICGCQIGGNRGPCSGGECWRSLTVPAVNAAFRRLIARGAAAVYSAGTGRTVSGHQEIVLAGGAGDFIFAARITATGLLSRCSAVRDGVVRQAVDRFTPPGMPGWPDWFDYQRSVAESN